MAGAPDVTRPREPFAPAPGPGPRTVPARALAISVLALAIPVGGIVVFPGRTSEGLGTLVWLSALIPPFLLAYYRGLRGVGVALSGGMAVITATQVGVVAFEIVEPDWALLAGIVVAYLAVSIGVAVLAEALRRERRMAEDLALVDRLTNLPNRRQLDLALESAFAGAERGGALSVVMLDLDHFKRVNDTYGHPVGDATIRSFADVLRANTRKEHLSARFGGEEFVCVLRGATVESAVKFAERVLGGMRQMVFPWGSQTASAGVAAYQPGMGSYELLLGAADRALYEAKAAGRDRVSVAEEFGERAASAAPPVPAAISSPLRPAAPIPVAAPTSRKPLLYVVDDDAEVREVVRLSLDAGGYDVWDTGDPKEAIRHFLEARDADRPDLILTDVIMPDMTGMTMIDQIVRSEPALRVVYMSGYVHGQVSWAGLPGAAVAFIEKPFAPATLLATVDEVARRELAAAVP